MSDIYVLTIVVEKGFVANQKCRIFDWLLWITDDSYILAIF